MREKREKKRAHYHQKRSNLDTSVKDQHMIETRGGTRESGGLDDEKGKGRNRRDSESKEQEKKRMNKTWNSTDAILLSQVHLHCQRPADRAGRGE